MRAAGVCAVDAAVTDSARLGGRRCGVATYRHALDFRSPLYPMSLPGDVAAALSAFLAASLCPSPPTHCLGELSGFFVAAFFMLRWESECAAGRLAPGLPFSSPVLYLCRLVGTLPISRVESVRPGGCGLWRRRSVMLWAGPLPGLEGWCVAGTGLPVAPCPAELVELLPRGGPPVSPPLYNVRGVVISAASGLARHRPTSTSTSTLMILIQRKMT